MPPFSFLYGEIIMDFKYKPTEYEFKLIVLYVIRNLKLNVTNTMLSYVAENAVRTDFFELQEYVQKLAEEGKVDELVIEGNNVYSISDKGEEILDFFEQDIPYSVKEKLDNAMKEYIDAQNDENKAKAEFRMISPTEYNVKCVIKENGAELLHIEFVAGSRETSKKFCDAFEGNEMEFYQRIMTEINNFMEK